MDPGERPNFYPRKVIRFPALKRNRENAPLNERVKLERVLGFTVSGNASLRSDPNTGTIIYPAGCAIVLFSPRKNKQSHILNVSKKTVTSLDVSSDGKYVVTGECGHLPNVRVWDIQEKAQVAEFTGHKYGINCVAFSPNLKYVVSVGSQHDMIVSVWDFRSGIKVASNKVSSKVKAVAFAEDGSYFVTVGNRHVKFWYLKCSSKSSKFKETVPLMGRSAILGEKRNNYFCDVACGKGDIASSTFSITKSGLLCEFNNRRLLDKWVELRTQGANCLSVGRSLIFIGCVDGIARCFNPYTLEYVTTLPRSHYLGVDVAMGLSIAHMAAQVPQAKYPDVVAITYDESNRKVTCVYSDHSMYIWDVKDIKKVGKSHSFLYHSACIWGVEVYPDTSDIQRAVLPAGSFITCSSDDTIRIWNLDPSMPNNTVYRKNLYCNELLKIVYVDEGLTYLCDMDRNPGGSNDKVDATYDTKNGVRCIRISPDGLNLASGDRSGNIRIHELQRMSEICNIEAHDGEVLNLEYSKPDTGYRFLASASRDRLIHVLDVDQDYAFLQTLDDHSSSITAVRFVQVGDRLQMISCGADKSVIFRTAQQIPQLQFIRDHHIVGKTTLYDMEVDVEQKNILTACQDRHIRVYAVGSGKHSKSFKGSIGEDGTLIKVVLDSSGLFAATSCTDKNLCVYNYATGECVATMFGHSELVTGLRFTNDCKHLISVSGDGCIFVWKLPLEITHQMHVRLAQIAPKMKQAIRKATSPQRSVHSANSTVNGDVDFRPAHRNMFDAGVGEVDDGGLAGYRFSIGQLPKWAKKEIADDASQSNVPEKTLSITQPKGRWAQRIDTQGLHVRSFYSSDHVIPFPGQVLEKGGPLSSENLPESQYHKYTDIRRETIVISKQGITNDHSDFLPCPESLHDIQFGASTQALSRSPTTVSTKRGSEVAYSSSRRRFESESSGGMQAEDFYAEQDHDGDAEDEESIETDHSAEMDAEIIYYPQMSDNLDANDGGFKVLATNKDELREAHRRMRKGKAERPTDLPIAGHDSDDEEEAVTPQGGERSILSMLNVSMESLDRVGQREKFMKSNYDSLEGDSANGKEEEASSTGIGSSLTDDGDPVDDHRQSLSARYLYRSSPTTPLRNVAVLNASKQKNEVSSQRRQEIMRQIEKTRQKLDTIGWKASMNSSKSIGDLTDLPEKDYPGGRYFSTLKGRPKRRSCSPSALANASSASSPLPTSSSLPNSMPSSPKKTIGNRGSSIVNTKLKLDKSSAKLTPQPMHTKRNTPCSSENRRSSLGTPSIRDPARPAHPTLSPSLSRRLLRGRSNSVDLNPSTAFEDPVRDTGPYEDPQIPTESYVFSSSSSTPTECDRSFAGDQPCSSPLPDQSSPPPIPSFPALRSSSSATNTKRKRLVPCDVQPQQAVANKSLLRKVAIQHLLPSKCDTDTSTQDSIRRASSMNDLSKPRRLLPPPPTDVSTPKSYASRSNGRATLNPSRPSTSNAMSRSTSMGTLNPSESDSDAGANTNKSNNASSLSRWNSGSSMRPTISSLNKSIGSKGSHDQLNAGGRTTPSLRLSIARPNDGTANNGRRNGETDRRRSPSVGLDNRRTSAAGSDSSSGEYSPTDTRPPPRGGLNTGHTSTLPRHHGRSSGHSLSLASRSRSEKDLSKTDGHDTSQGATTNRPSYARRNLSTSMSASTSRGQRPSAVNGHMLEKSPQELPVKDNLPQPIDVTSAPLSRELCDVTAQGLKQSADNMLQLYKRVYMDSDMHESERKDMMNCLCEGTAQAQQTLRPIAGGGYASSQQNSLEGVTKSTDSLNWKVSDTTTVPENMNGPPSMFPIAGRQGLDQNQFLQQCAEWLSIAIQQQMRPPT